MSLSLSRLGRYAYHHAWRVLFGWLLVIGAVIALKGLGRFAELRGDTPGTAERFLIGSFTSLLWAGVLAGLARLLAGSAGLT